MNIQYISDEVTYTAPNDTQNDYEAVINIIFCVDNGDDTFSPEYVYTQTLTGGTSILDSIDLFNKARSQITNDTLSAYAQGTPTLYTPPTGNS